MRISDWSSDVCSSDLPEIEPWSRSSDRVVAFVRNAWSPSIGTPGRNHRNPHKSNRKQFRPFDAGAYSRAGYHRHWQARAPCREETDLQGANPRRALANRRYGNDRKSAVKGKRVSDSVEIGGHR